MKRQTGILLLTIVMLAACRTTTAGVPIILEHSSATSECGGFVDPFPTKDETRAIDPPGSGECDAELLRWSFDADSGALKLRNEKVILNCCGDHSVEVTVQEDALVMTETDAPEGGDGRCKCICNFDFSAMVKLAPTVSGTVPVKIVRLVTDVDGGGEKKDVFSTTIDLDVASGSYCSSDPNPTSIHMNDEGCDALAGDAKYECFCKAKGKSGLGLNLCICRAKGKSGMRLHRCVCKRMGRYGKSLHKCMCRARTKTTKGMRFVRCVKRLQKKAKKQVNN